MSCLAPCRPDADGSGGSALVIVLMGMLLLSALALATVLLATADTLAASNQRDARVALYSAESSVERAASELVGRPDWDAVLSGAVTSAYVDGPASGSRVLADGRTIHLEQIANLANCDAVASCSAAAREAVTEDRPWGLNNPHWRPYSYGFTNAGGPGRAVYVVVLVADDPSENDADPDRDGVAPGNPGAGMILLRGEAFGPGESRRSVEVTVARVSYASGLAAPRLLSWREVR
jgi:PilX N-terminal